MRFFALLWLCVAGWIAPAAPSQTGSEAQSNQQKARAVLDKMIASLGGAAYLNLQDSYSEGRYGRFHNEVMVGGAEYFRYWQWPDKDRWELTKQRDVVTLYLGEKAYEVTYRGATQLNPQKDDNVRLALLRRHYALENVVRVWLDAPGTALLDEGPSMAENRMAERITIINANDEAVTLLISTDTYLPLQKIFSIRDPQTRDRDEEVEVYDNWRMMQGINTPLSVLVKHNGQIARQQFVNNIVYNTHPPASYFTPILIKRKVE